MPPARDKGTAQTISLDVLRRPEWQERVRLRHAELLRADAANSPVTGNRSLVLLKRAMQEVARSMMKAATMEQDVGQSDRLSVVLRFLRAWDQGRYGAARKLARQWQLGNELEEASRWHRAGEEAAAALRQEAMRLAREAYVTDLRDAQAAAATTPPEQQLRRRGQLLARLKRLKPGATTTLSAVRGEDGTIHQDAAGMAAALRQYWSRVFGDKRLAEADMDQWLAAAYPNGDGLGTLPRSDSMQWRLRRRDVKRAVNLSGSSSPGPDGLPYLAWRQLGTYGVDVLWGALKELESEQGTEHLETAYVDEPACQFNLGLLACIPKVTGQVVAPDETRPISMVDTSNRLLASAARLRWERILGAWVAPSQKGFLPGRSLLSNVVELEHEAMMTSLKESDGAVILLDFAAAFPSISQKFLRKALAHIGMPPSALRLLDALYYKTECVIQVGGVRFAGFAQQGGIRQGCPLSPLLFVAAMDGLLRLLPRRVPAAVPKAFADDTAVLLQNLRGDLPLLHRVFEELRRATGLQLNMRKCIIIPLGDSRPQVVRAYLERSFSPWFGATVDTHGRYLGFEIGPGKGVTSWIKPSQKARDRVAAWSWGELGLYYSTQVWNAMVLSLFLFVGQLEQLPQPVLDDEARLLRRAAPGAGGWCGTNELHRLRRSYGLAGEFKSLAATVEAAQFRVACRENSEHGGLQVRRRTRMLAEARRTTEHIDREHRWSGWYDASHCRTLQAALEKFRVAGITEQLVDETAAGIHPRPWTQATAQLIRQRFQRTAGDLMARQDQYDAERWTRRKLWRWNLRDRRQAARSLTRLRGLGVAVPPRVVAAVLGCIWNKWPTARRSQRRGHPCLLGCGAGEDSVEHYVGCRLTRAAARRWLGIRYRFSDPMEHWMLAAPTCVEVEGMPHWWARVALLIYAVQQVTNSLRHSTQPPLCEDDIRRALRQGLLEGARGHSTAVGLLRCGSWA